MLEAKDERVEVNIMNYSFEENDSAFQVKMQDMRYSTTISFRKSDFKKNTSLSQVRPKCPSLSLRKPNNVQWKQLRISGVKHILQGVKKCVID